MSIDSSSITITILIVNYNGISFLGQCLNSIREYVKIPYEVILVDNASCDESVYFVESNYPDVRIVNSKINLGFAGGNNAGATIANGSLLLLLNNDTKINSDISPLIDIMNENDRIGVLGCRLFYGDGRQQESVGYIPNVWNIILSWTPLSMLFPKVKYFRRTKIGSSDLYLKNLAEVEWVSGAFFLTRTDLWKKLGGLDEKYFMYMEDTDFCRRIRDYGYKVVYSASCEVMHFEGSGKRWIGKDAILNSTDSYMVYIKKYYGNVELFILRMLLALVFLVRSIGYIFANILGKEKEMDGYEKAKAYSLAALNLLLGRVSR